MRYFIFFYEKENKRFSVVISKGRSSKNRKLQEDSQTERDSCLIVCRIRLLLFQSQFRRVCMRKCPCVHTYVRYRRSTAQQKDSTKSSQQVCHLILTLYHSLHISYCCTHVENIQQSLTPHSLRDIYTASHSSFHFRINKARKKINPMFTRYMLDRIIAEL